METPAYNLANLVVEPVTIITSTGIKPVVLAHDRQLVDFLDGSTGLVEGIHRECFNREASFQADRVLFDCLAIKAA